MSVSIKGHGARWAGLTREGRGGQELEVVRVKQPHGTVPRRRSQHRQRRVKVEVEDRRGLALFRLQLEGINCLTIPQVPEVHDTVLARAAAPSPVRRELSVRHIRAMALVVHDTLLRPHIPHLKASIQRTRNQHARCSVVIQARDARRVPCQRPCQFPARHVKYLDAPTLRARRHKLFGSRVNGETHDRRGVPCQACDVVGVIHPPHVDNIVVPARGNQSMRWGDGNCIRLDSVRHKLVESLGWGRGRCHGLVCAWVCFGVGERK